MTTISTNSGLPGLSDLAFGPDGNLWFTEPDSMIGRLDLSPTPEPLPGPTLIGSSLQDQVGGNGESTSTLIAPVGQATTFQLAGDTSSAGVTVDSATVDWGDGSTPTAGTLTPNPSAQGAETEFADGTVSGSHTYAKAGSYTVTITIDGTGPTGEAMTTSVVETATAVDPTPSPSLQPPLILQAAKSIAYQGPLAIFSTPTPHDASGSDFTATVDWGDGSAPTTGAVSGGEDVNDPTPVFDSETSGPAIFFEVSGDHTYATAGTFTVKVTLTDQFGHSSTESTSIQVEPGPLDLNLNSPILVTADPTPASSGPYQDSIELGTLTDYTGSLLGETDSLTVDWGDGSAPTTAAVEQSDAYGSSPSGGSLSFSPSQTGYIPLTGLVLDVTGTHAYAQAGTYTVKLTAPDNQGNIPPRRPPPSRSRRESSRSSGGPSRNSPRVQPASRSPTGYW